ncbi:MAG: DUF1850 domain-containing protein [Proteobacteria bacterium]|nr:DUF1850 domain-containing protein [Pseudomonadota bacterium]
MPALCLALAAALTAPVAIPAPTFTLAWTHSIEHQRWEEDYALTPTGLRLVRARVRGSGAGMEPAANARLEEGWYVWEPAADPVPELRLTRSGHTADYDLCLPGQPCAPLSHWLPSDGGVTGVWACEPPPARRKLPP